MYVVVHIYVTWIMIKEMTNFDNFEVDNVLYLLYSSQIFL